MQVIEQSIPVLYVVLGLHRDAGGAEITDCKVEFTRGHAVLAAARLLASYADDSGFYVMIAEYNWDNVSMYVNDYRSK